MSTFSTHFNIDNSKSYATEQNLLKALEKLGFIDDRFVVVCNRQGRFTAVFGFSNITDGDATRYARHGFMTIN